MVHRNQFLKCKRSKHCNKYKNIIIMYVVHHCVHFINFDEIFAYELTRSELPEHLTSQQKRVIT